MFSGIPVQPSIGSKRTRYPDVRFQATFFLQGSVGTFITLPRPIEAKSTADNSGVGRDTSDIIQCSVYKGIDNPVGTWSMTLVPRQDYLGQINPGDWCKISGDNGDGMGMRVLCYGPVKSASLQKSVSEKGITRSIIQFSGTDFGETLSKTSGVYDAQLASEVATLTYASIATASDIPSGTPGTIVRAIIGHYLGIGVRQLVDPQTSMPFANTLNLDYIDNAGTLGAAVPAAINPATSLWQLLQQWANLSVNELFADYRPPYTNQDSLTQLVPSVVLRQCPFWGQDWQNLTTVNIESDEVTDLQLSKSDADVRNWIRPLYEGDPSQFITQENIGIINPASIERFGFRRYENPTAFTSVITPTDPFAGSGYNSGPPPTTPSAGGIASVLKAVAALQALWHHSNEKLLSGSVVMCFRPEIRVGYKLVYKDLDTQTQYEFYVEGVQHSFAYPGASTTHLTLTRGRDVADPLFRQPIASLKTQGVITELGNTVTANLSTTLKGLTQ